ncbi:MAG: trypsin-like serine protease [Myxococcaceae bacterium]
MQSIVGGSIDHDGGYPSVFFVRMEFDNGMRAACSSTLITPRSLLTAAHCVDPAMAGANTVEIYVLNDSPAPPSDAGMWIHATDHAYHPMWDHNSPTDYDVGMILLPSAPPVTPVPFESRDESSLPGADLKVVGWGITMQGAMDYGVRREVDLIVRNVDSQHLIIGDQNSKGICNGDSGGPSFHTGADGVMRVVGVHSYDNGGCVDGLDTRPDVYKAFIEDFINTKEGAGCGEDGICKSGCTPADVDCVCIPDGQCSAACPNLLTDPDCPVNCVANGVCSTVDCPTLDPDCTAEYSTCTADSQCEHRDCANDEANMKKYCSRHCAMPTDCPSPSVCTAGECLIDQGPVANPGEECTFGTTRCLQNTNCTSLGGANDRCAFPCGSDTDCDPGLVCKAGSNNFKLCVPPPPPPDMKADAGDGPGVKGSCGNCSSAAGLQLLALLLFARKLTSPSSRR